MKWTQKAAAIVAAIFVWQAIAMLLNHKILLASPVDVVGALGDLLFQPAFYQAVLFSLGRIIGGFLLAFVLGSILAILCAQYPVFRIVLWPYMAVIKATPVASVIILLLVWFSSRNISIIVSMMMVLPVVYTNVYTGICSLDEKLEEMADMYEIKPVTRFLHIRLGQLRKSLLACVEIGVSMAVKAGVAAEVIGVPACSIGRGLYDAKIYLATPQLFAWTAVLVSCSVVLEKGMVQLMRAVMDWPRKGLL